MKSFQLKANYNGDEELETFNVYKNSNDLYDAYSSESYNPVSIVIFGYNYIQEDFVRIDGDVLTVNKEELFENLNKDTIYICIETGGKCYITEYSLLSVCDIFYSIFGYIAETFYFYSYITSKNINSNNKTINQFDGSIINNPLKSFI